MNPAWFFRPDWPDDFELKMRASLMEAIRNIPHGDGLDEADVEGKALMLRSASSEGRNEELPRNRPASQKTSENELRNLAALAEKLERHILKMHQPAVSALYTEGAYVFELVRALQETRDNAHHAFSMLDIDGSPSGAPRKIEAAEVAFLAAGIFENVSGRRATFTTDPFSGDVSGAWPEFLSAVFEALWIEASVAAQVRALSEKRPQKMVD